MSSHSVNHSTCVNCELCIVICPTGIVSKNERGDIVFREDRMDLCIRCGHCMAMCGHKSISIEGLSYDKNFRKVPDKIIDQHQFMDFLMTRRSVRIFKDRPVEREVLEKIVEMISTVPFGVDPDNVHLTLVSDKKMIEKALPVMAEMYRQMYKVFRTPVVGNIILKSMPKEMSATLKDFIIPHISKGFYIKPEEMDDISRNAPAMILFHAPKDAGEHTVDSHICLTYAFLAAHSLGMGATTIGLIAPAITRTKSLRNHFLIPDGHEVLEALIIGYPKYRFKHAIIRPKKNITYLS